MGDFEVQRLLAILARETDLIPYLDEEIEPLIEPLLQDPNPSDVEPGD